MCDSFNTTESYTYQHSVTTNLWQPPSVSHPWCRLYSNLLSPQSAQGPTRSLSRNKTHSKLSHSLCWHPTQKRSIMCTMHNPHRTTTWKDAWKNPKKSHPYSTTGATRVVPRNNTLFEVVGWIVSTSCTWFPDRANSTYPFSNFPERYTCTRYINQVVASRATCFRSENLFTFSTRHITHLLFSRIHKSHQHVSVHPHTKHVWWNESCF